MSKTKTVEPTTMAELVEQLGDQLTPFKQSDVIEVTVLNTTKDHVVVDVQGLATGLIPAKEYGTTPAKYQAGDKIRAYVLSTENDKGYVILSLKRAEKERLWNMLEQRNDDGEIINVRVIQANKGGLVAEYNDMQGFLPVSQLSFKHYPRVGGDKSKIQTKLAELIGQTIPVKVINYDKAANKIIFSEKAAGDADMAEKAKEFEVGQRVNGKITGITEFGLFISLGEIEGLVHISQVSWQRVTNLKEMFKVGDDVEAEVLNVDGGRISLSIKKLQPDPWQIEAKELKVAQVVEGIVTKVTPYGAFVRISENLEGLFKPAAAVEGAEVVAPQVEEGKSYQFEIVSIEPELRKIALRLQDAPAKK